MKIPVQDKIAELERRVRALEEQRQPVDAVSRTTVTRTTAEPGAARPDVGALRSGIRGTRKGVSLMADIDIVRQAKADLEAHGQTWNTTCDAYKITNLAAQRAGWKVIQKTSGDHCESRKVDGLIVNGRAIDCLVAAGPPLNRNEPQWMDMGPQAALVALDPLPWPDPVKPTPPDPIPPSGDLEQRIATLERQMASIHTATG